MTNPYHVFAAWKTYKRGESLIGPSGRKSQKKAIKKRTTNKSDDICHCVGCLSWRNGKRKYGCKKPKKDWHRSKRWRDLRKQALDFYGDTCHCCGAEGKDIQIHVDHIKPKSKYPELAYSFDNLQILCRKCNFVKNNLHETDYRKSESGAKTSEKGNEERAKICRPENQEGEKRGYFSEAGCRPCLWNASPA